MQCSAWRPISSASTSVRPPSSSTRWNSRGPSPSRTPVHSDVYGFIRSAVEERGSSCRKTSRSRHSGSTFSIPITVTSTSGSVVHMRPLPSDSTTHDRAGLGDREVGPADRHRHGQELLAQVQPRRLGDRLRLVAELLALGDRAHEQRADLLAVLVDRRHQDVRLACRGRAGRSARPGRSRSRRSPAAPSASLSPISSVTSDLTLITSRAPWSRAIRGDDRVGLGPVARPVHGAAGAL